MEQEKEHRQSQLKAELEKIWDKRQRDKRPGHFTMRRSKLAKYHAEIVELRQLGASLEDIKIWLRRKRVKVERSTIHRYLKKEC